MAGTGTEWANLFPQRVLDLAALETYLQDPLRDAATQGLRDLWDAGGVLGSQVVLTEASGLISVDAAAVGLTDTGRRLILDPAGLGLASVPYAAAAGVGYDVGARFGEVPVGGSPGFDGTPGFDRWKEAIGFALTADSVAEVAGSLVFDLSSALAVPMRWAAEAPTRAVTIWKTTPATSGAEIVAEGVISYSATDLDWTVTIPHTFGQLASSTTPADYVVFVHGLELALAGAGLASEDGVLYLGTLLDAVHDGTGQNLIGALGSLWQAFQAEHNPTTGAHTTISADSIGTDDLSVANQAILSDGLLVGSGGHLEVADRQEWVARVTAPQLYTLVEFGDWAPAGASPLQFAVVPYAANTFSPISAEEPGLELDTTGTIVIPVPVDLPHGAIIDRISVEGEWEDSATTSNTTVQLCGAFDVSAGEYPVLQDTGASPAAIEVQSTSTSGNRTEHSLNLTLGDRTAVDRSGNGQYHLLITMKRSSAIGTRNRFYSATVSGYVEHAAVAGVLQST